MNFELTIKKVALLITCCLLLVSAVPLAMAQEEGTQSGVDEVREKVREQIEDLSRKPRATVGVLTEITDLTLEIKTLDGKIAQVATNEETVYIRTARNKTSTIEFDELVLGDFAIAMGFANGNDVLEVQRIITYDKTPLVQRQSICGTVTANNNGDLVIETLSDQEKWIVETSSKTAVTTKEGDEFVEIDLDTVETGDKIVAAGLVDEKEENTLTAGQIHLLPRE